MRDAAGPSEKLALHSKTLPLSGGPPQNHIIVIPPTNMLVNGLLTSASSAEDTANARSGKIMIQRQPPISLNRPLSYTSSDSCYGSDTENGDSASKIKIGKDGKIVRKRTNLDHLTQEEKVMRRKLKNRVAAQNARDKKKSKMDEMEDELARLRAHAKALEKKNADLVEANMLLQSQNESISKASEFEAAGAGGPLVVDSRSVESAVLINDSQQQDQDRLTAGGFSAGKWPLMSAKELTSLPSIFMEAVEVIMEHGRNRKP